MCNSIGSHGTWTRVERAECFLEGYGNTSRACAIGTHKYTNTIRGLYPAIDCSRAMCLEMHIFLLNHSDKKGRCIIAVLFQNGRPSEEDPGCLCPLLKADDLIPLTLQNTHTHTHTRSLT